MANIKSQIKRNKTNEARRVANAAYKSALKTSIKKTLNAVENKDKAQAVTLYNETAAKLDKAVSKGVHHKNYAARQKSRISKLVNSIE